MTDDPQVWPANQWAGEDDRIQRLWTPHRLAYVQSGEHKPADDQAPSCPFCRVPGGSDEDGLIVHRGSTCFVVLNLFPYSPGHLLVCPYRHIPDLTDTTDEELDELSRLTRRAMTVLRSVSHPDGFNLGMNQGAVAGAGIAAHLHQHVVPRWRGDANFFPIIARTKAVPQLLGDTRDLVAEAWQAS